MLHTVSLVVVCHADDYQPPCFKAAESEAVGHFARRPFSMNIGDIDTHHHTVGLKVSPAPQMPFLLPQLRFC